MSISKKIFRGVLCLLIMLCVGCNNDAQQKRDIVAEVGDNSQITFKELKTFTVNYLYDRRFRKKEEAYSKALDQMITNQLERIDFVERGLDKDEALLKSIARTISEETIVEYFNSEFLGKYTNDDFVYQTYQAMSREVEYQQIVLKKSKRATKNELESIKRKAEKIKSKIDQGADFTEYVHLYSEDAESAAQDGYMPPITWKSRSENPKNSTIFNYKPGDIIFLETDDSFCIVKVTKINTIKMEPFEKMKEQIVENNKKEYLDISLEEYAKEKQKLIDESNLNWDKKALQQLLEWWKEPEFFNQNYQRTIQNFIDEGENRTILKYADGKVDYKELLRLFNNVLIPKGSKYSKIENVKDYILEAIRTDMVLKKAQALGFSDHIIDPNTKNDVIQISMVRLYRQKVLDPQIPEPTEEALQRFYEDNRDSLYYQLEKVNIYVLLYDNKEEAERIWQKVKQGADFKDVSRRWVVKTYIKDRDGKIKIDKEKDSKVLAETAFTLKEGETKGVIEYIDPEKGRQFAIIKCSHHRPKKQLTFEDVQKNIKADFKEFNEKRIQREVARDLRKKYRVVIHKKVLENNLKTIQWKNKFRER